MAEEASDRTMTVSQDKIQRALDAAAFDAVTDGPRDGRYPANLDLVTRYTLADIKDVFHPDEEFVRAKWLDEAVRQIKALEARVSALKE